MNNLQAFFLGVVQGLAEFLPISSSGHLFLAKDLLSLSDVPLLFDLVLHVATLLAVCILFRATIARLFMAFIRFISRKTTADDQTDLKMIGLIIIATLVTIMVGLPLDSLTITTTHVLVGFLITSAMMVGSHFYLLKFKSPFPVNEKSWLFQGAFIGFIQGIAVLPGISRSGSTISAALFSGLNRKEAGELSFILSIPAILGGFLIHLRDLDSMEASVAPLPLLISFVAAFITGLLALKLLMRMIQSGKLYYFAFYLVPLAIFGLIFIQ